MASISASHSNISIVLDVSETYVNVPENYSDVSWTLRMVRPYQIYSSASKSYSVNINGNVTSGTVTVGGVGDFNIATGAHRIYHDGNGTKTIGISFSQELKLNYNGWVDTLSASGSMTLSNIPRQATITGANNVNDEQNPSMTFSNPAGYDMWAELEINPNNTHLFGRVIPNTGSYTFELTEQERETMRSYIPNSNSATLRYLIYSNNKQWVSYIDKTYTIVNGNPEFENFTYQDTNTDVTNITGDNQVLVKGLSNLQATISVSDKMTAIKESTEKNYVASIDTINQSQNYDDDNDIVFDLGTVNVSGTQRLNVRAYDSRNNSTLVYKDITVFDYSKPAINLTAERLNNFEDQTTLRINGTFSSLIIDNLEKNTVQSVQYRYKEKDNSTWGNWNNVAFTINNNEFLCTDVIIVLDNTKEYDIEVKVIDNLSNNSVATSIDIGKSIFFISSNLKKCYINDKRVVTEDELSVYQDFSSPETVVGELFGKPLYRQVLDLPLSQNQTQRFSVPNSNTFEVISKLEGTIRITAPHGWLPLTFFNNQYVFCFFNIGSNLLEVKSDWGGNRAIIIIEYTKTTDNVVSL